MMGDKSAPAQMAHLAINRQHAGFRRNVPLVVADYMPF
jgi:hypothetical protein